MQKRAFLRPAAARAALSAFFLVLVLATACNPETFSVEASGPFPYRTAADPQIERVAVLVTIRNLAQDDLLIEPASFVARDRDNRIFPANPVATVADANTVRLAASPAGKGDILPLPTATLRQGEVVSGFVVFDVPLGVRPSVLIFRQVDADRVAEISSVATSQADDR